MLLEIRNCLAIEVTAANRSHRLFPKQEYLVLLS